MGPFSPTPLYGYPPFNHLDVRLMRPETCHLRPLSGYRAPLNNLCSIALLYFPYNACHCPKVLPRYLCVFVYLPHLDCKLSEGKTFVPFSIAALALRHRTSYMSQSCLLTIWTYHVWSVALPSHHGEFSHSSSVLAQTVS